MWFKMCCLGNRDETNIPRRSDGNTGTGQNSLLIPLSSVVTLSFFLSFFLSLLPCLSLSLSVSLSLSLSLSHIHTHGPHFLHA